MLRYLSQRPVKRQLRLRRTREDAFVPPGSVGTDIEKKLKVLIGAMVFSTVCIFVRSVYRTIELLDGVSRGRSLRCPADCAPVFIALLIPASPSPCMQPTTVDWSHYLRCKLGFHGSTRSQTFSLLLSER